MRSPIIVLVLGVLLAAPRAVSALCADGSPPPCYDPNGVLIEEGHTVEAQVMDGTGGKATQQETAQVAGKTPLNKNKVDVTGESLDNPGGGTLGTGVGGALTSVDVIGGAGNVDACDKKCHIFISGQIPGINQRIQEFRATQDPERRRTISSGLISQYIGSDPANTILMKQIGRMLSTQLSNEQTGNPGAQPPPNPESRQNGDELLGNVIDLNQQRFPKDPAQYTYRGERDLRGGRAEDALTNFQKAIDLGANDKRTFIGMGSAAHQLGDMELAAKMGEKVLGMDPTNQKALSLYNLSAGRGPRGAEAPGMEAGKSGAEFLSPGAAANLTPAQIAAAAAAQAAAPASAVQKSAAFTREAGSLLKVKDFSEAHAKASQAIAENPKNAQAWNYRAIADNKLKRYNDAVYDASYSLGLVPGNSPALASRSWAFSKQKKYQEGLADASAVLEQEPSNAYALQNAALAFAGLGKREQMIESLRRSAELNPQFRDRYEKALQAPQDADVTFLFDDAPAGKAAAVAAPAIPKKKRMMMLSLTSVVGGLLVAMGFLHVFSAAWREKVRTTMKRIIGGPSVGQSPDSGEAAASGLWGQYELIRELGTGGMGVVYEAKDSTLERTVAIKKMRDEIRIDPRERSRFMSEAKTVASLHHPSIVDIYSIIEEAGDVYLVFEYVDGRNLSDVLRENGPMPFETARGIMKSACEAVDYAHRHKIIHRDLKPSNIMISSAGEAKVMDFGVARQAQDAMSKALMTNTVVGTPPYMAPEQEQGTVRPESDVYALGIVLYEMLSGQLPFAGQGAGMLLNKINGRFNPLSQSVAGPLPAGIDEVMAKALNADPDRRYRTPADLLAAIEGLALAKTS